MLSLDVGIKTGSKGCGLIVKARTRRFAAYSSIFWFIFGYDMVWYSLVNSRINVYKGFREAVFVLVRGNWANHERCPD